MNMQITEQAKTEIRDTINANIRRMNDALATAKPNQLVWAWSHYGLGVIVNADGISTHCISRATVITKPDSRTFKNGNGEFARLMPRREALEVAILAAQKSLAIFA